MNSLLDRISVNAQSSIRIDCGKIIRFDPFILKDEPHDADVIFFTHGHHDHFSPEDIAKVTKPETLFVAPESMKEALGKAGIDADHTLFVQVGKKYEISGIRFETVPAYNRLKLYHKKSDGWVGYVVDTDVGRVYIAGDTDGLAENTSLNVDVALIPVGGKFTMDAKEAAEFINKLRPGVAIPTHFGGMIGGDDDDKKFESLVDVGIEVVFKM